VLRTLREYRWWIVIALLLAVAAVAIGLWMRGDGALDPNAYPL
jgi:hypothetical protein